MAFRVSAITGALRHSLGWLFSPMVDIVTPNPNYQQDPDGKKKGTAIYCVHGTADRSIAFSHITKGLLPNLPKQISHIHQLSFKGRGRGNNIPYFADQLIEKIIANGDEDVILMGHSRGGLIAAYASEKLAHAKKINVKAVVPICSPFQGSPRAIAPLSWISDSVLQMQPGSEFLAELNQFVDESHPELLNRSSAEQERMRAQYLFFVAENDLLVGHDSSFVHRNNATVVPMEGHGHLSIMTSNRIVNFLQNFFKRLFPDYKITLAERDPAHLSQQDGVIKVAIGQHENILLVNGKFYRERESEETVEIKEFENIDISRLTQFLDNEELRIAYLKSLQAQSHANEKKHLTRNLADWYFEKDVNLLHHIHRGLTLSPFQLEKERLERVLHDEAHHEQREPGIKLLIEIENLSPTVKKAHSPMLTEIMQRTSRAIQDPYDVDNLERYKEIINTHQQENMRRVAKAMLYVIAGVAMVAISTAIAVASFGAATLPGVLGIMLGVGLLAKAAAIVNTVLAIGMVASGSHNLSNRQSPVHKVTGKAQVFFQENNPVSASDNVSPEISGKDEPSIKKNNS